MQVSTKTTVYIDGTEFRDVLAEHLRSKGILPEGAKFTMHVSLGADLENRDVGKRPGLVIKDRDSARVTIEWPAQTDGPKVVGRVGI